MQGLHGVRQRHLDRRGRSLVGPAERYRAHVASFVLATIQGNVAGVYVQGVTLVTGSSGSFTIHLNKAVPESVSVAWFAVN